MKMDEQRLTPITIADFVKRDTTELGYQGWGIALQVNGDCAWVQWADKKTWYNVHKLIRLRQPRIDEGFTRIKIT